MGWHCLTHGEEFSVRANLGELSCIFVLDAVTIKLTHFPTFYLTSCLRRVIIPSLNNSEENGDALKVSGFFISDSVEAHMLENANSIRVRCVDVLSKELPVDISLVEPSQILLEDSHFDQLREEVLQIRQRHERLV